MNECERPLHLENATLVHLDLQILVLHTWIDESASNKGHSQTEPNT